MNPRRRLLTTLRGGRVDRVPLVLQGFHFPSLESIQDAATREIAGRILEETHFDLVFPSYINRYLVTPPQRIREVSRRKKGNTIATISEIESPKGVLTAVTGSNEMTQTVWTIKYPVESLEDIEKIRGIPWELPLELAPPDLSTAPVSFRDRGIAYTSISSPFVCVAGMMPFELFLEMCATELGLVKELTAQCQERILDVLRVLLKERSIEYVWMGGCEWLTPPMGSPDLYNQLVQVFEGPLIERIHAGGAVCHVHCHGNVRSTLERAIERGADYFEPVEPPPDGDITFASAKTLAAGRITLGGNIEARVIENESAESVEAAVRAAFQGDRNRMVLSTSSGPISRLTPRMIENYHRIVDLWEEISPPAVTGNA